MSFNMNPRVSATLKAIALIIFGIFAFLWIFENVGELVSEPNSTAVLVGVVILVLMIFAAVFWGIFLVKEVKKIFMLGMIIVFCFLTLNGCVKVEPGYVGIKVNQYGTQKGVEDFPLMTGRVWLNPFTEDVYKFPTFLQNWVWTQDPNEGSPTDEAITFNSIEGAVINTDIAVSFGYISEKVPSLFVEYRQDPEHIARVYVRSKIRDYFNRIASSMKVTAIFGAGKQELLDRVKEIAVKDLEPKGFKFDMIGFVGEMRVDPTVKASINAVIEATQRAIEAENKIRQADAEAQQKIKTSEGTAQSLINVAKGQAEANRIVNASLTQALIQWQAVQTWNGILPQVTGGAVPFVNIQPVK